ncbi:12904_t:CDS:2, partial [Ambispora leptoticha]
MSSTEAKLRSLKVPELKDLLTKKGLPVSGKKEDLINRLLAFEVDEKVTTITTTTDSNDANNNSIARNTASIKAQNNGGINSNGENIASGIAGDSDTKTGDTDLFEKDITNSPVDHNSALDADFDWDDIKLTTDEFNDAAKDAELDSLHSLNSPIEKTKTDNPLNLADKKSGTASANINTSSTSISDSQQQQQVSTSTTEPEIIVKPTGFKCKKITFNAPPPQSTPVTTQSDNNLSSELEKRKKRAERFGVNLSETDKKLERAVKFGIQVSSPVDSPLKAERPILQKQT